MPAMHFVVTPEQEMLRDAARAYLADKAPPARVRELMESADGFDGTLWNGMAELGWMSMAVPEEYGGVGSSYLELGVLIEEMGRTLVPSPFYSSVVLGASMLLIAGSEAQRRTYLPDVASGGRRVTVALVEPGGDWSAVAMLATARGAGESLALSGRKSYVLDGHTADLLVVSARDERNELNLYLVDAAANGVSIRQLETMDLTRRQSEIELSGVRPLEQLGRDGSAEETVHSLYDIAAVMLAFEQVGGAQKCMEMSVAYAKERMQFGRPIGSFQAIKHKCAQMLVDIEAARSTALYAGWALSSGDSDLPVAAALAKVRCSDAYFDVAAETIQVHGGIGFTWEHDAHLYFKRAKTDQLLFGTPSQWRAKLGDRLGL